MASPDARPPASNPQAAPPAGHGAEDLNPSAANPLVAAANPLLNLIPQIRETPTHPDPASLRVHLIDEIRRFELRAQRAGIPSETIIGARYCLCTALDEAAALAPWGGGAWASHSLLVTFHNETWGGEKFFQLLARLSQNPAAHLDLLELLYYCLALGFEGRYRVLDNGRGQLETLRQRLLLILRNARPPYAQPLAQHWQDRPAQVATRKLPLPLWACAALVAALGLLLFLLLGWKLANRSDAVFASIHGLLPERAIAAPVPAPPASTPQRPQRLAGFLEPEIREGLVAVRDEADRSVVILRGDQMFDSGADAVRDRYLPVISRVADALNATSGNILVTGHTDDVPIRSARFPSNWHLSQARADSVKDVLERRLATPNRVRAEGRGSAEPVAPNDSAQNRARNRRVEITLLLGSQGPASGGAR